VQRLSERELRETSVSSNDLNVMEVTYVILGNYATTAVYQRSDTISFWHSLVFLSVVEETTTLSHGKQDMKNTFVRKVVLIIEVTCVERIFD
jgi:hypothetical protein